MKISALSFAASVYRGKGWRGRASPPYNSACGRIFGVVAHGPWEQPETTKMAISPKRRLQRGWDARGTGVPRSRRRATGQDLAAGVLLLRKAAGGEGINPACRRRVFQLRGAVRGADSLLRAAYPVKNSQAFVQQVRERTAHRPPSLCRRRHRWSTCRTRAPSSTWRARPRTSSCCRRCVPERRGRPVPLRRTGGRSHP